MQKQTSDKTKLYSPVEAIDLVKKNAKEKFDASVEVNVNLGIDAKKGDQHVRLSVTLPHGTGKTKKVLVIAEGEAAIAAKSAGADKVGGQEIVEEIKKSGQCDFDAVVATPDMMKLMAPIARILGPRGLMPAPKNGTVTMDAARAVAEIKKGKINLKNDDTGNVHAVIGKVSFDNQKLLENYQAFMDVLTKGKPSASKGVFIKSVTMSSTMGEGVRVIKS